jgi:hypothetical protein
MSGDPWRWFGASDSARLGRRPDLSHWNASDRNLGFVKTVADGGPPSAGGGLPASDVDPLYIWLRNVG